MLSAQYPVPLAPALQAQAHQLFDRTFAHPILSPVIEWAPARWLLWLANPNPSDKTDLGTWDPTQPNVGMEELFSDMLNRGMRDPLIVGVGRVAGRVRLEAGNHRVRVMLQKGFEWLPSVAYVGDSAITHLENGEHPGHPHALQLPPYPDIMGPYPVKTYQRLSEVLAQWPR